MPRCSEAAIEAALTELSEHAASRRARSSWMSTYLAAQRMQAADYPMNTTGANSAILDLFTLVPDNPVGRSNPFVDLQSQYRWGLVKNSGRMTVWNMGTRNGNQTPLFNADHFENGLRPDAIDVLLEKLGTSGPLPGRDALAVLLTRDREWEAEPSRAELIEAAAQFLGLSIEDFERITEDRTLDMPTLGNPEWSPELIEASAVGPPKPAAVISGAGGGEKQIPIESVQEMPAQFEHFLSDYGIAVSSDEEILDILASTLSSQLIIMAGPSGTGKSLMSAALAAFFAPITCRRRLESNRLLAKPEEFLGYYSHFAGEQFMATDQLMLLLEIPEDSESPPFVIIEEANLSPIEGYLSPLVHGLSQLESEHVSFRLHTMQENVKGQAPELSVPPTIDLRPYPRFFVTINVDADSPAPARKVVSRSCVLLLNTPSLEVALAAADTVVHPSVEEADGQAASFIERPSIAYDRYVESGSNVLHQALAERAEMLRDQLGLDVVGHRQFQRSLLYMAWYVELAAVVELEQGDPSVEAAADNSMIHFVLPSLPASQFERALAALDDGKRTGVLASRLSHLKAVLEEQHFGPPPDFWGALS